MRHWLEYDPLREDFSPEDFGRHLRMLMKEVCREKQKEKVLFLCIGSDRCTGDSLGPLIGHRLRRSLQGDWVILGTLHQPVHALNLKETLKQMEEKYPGHLVVAVDASLGRCRQVGKITVSRGALLPGRGLQKDLDAVGDIAITGVVGILNHGPWSLPNTRLSLVMDLAEAISGGILSSLENSG